MKTNPNNQKIKAMEKPTDVLLSGEYTEPATFESDQEAILFYSYLEMISYIEYLQAKVTHLEKDSNNG